MYRRWSSPGSPSKRSLVVQILQNVLRGQKFRTFREVSSGNFQTCLQISWVTKDAEIWTKNIDVENSTFNPVIFAFTDGVGPSASKVISRLALKLSGKGQDYYSDAIGYIRTRDPFALLSSSILCIRVSGSVRRHNFEESSIFPVVEERRLPWFIWTAFQW